LVVIFSETMDREPMRTGLGTRHGFVFPGN
jgi:hypothetical protein